MNEVEFFKSLQDFDNETNLRNILDLNLLASFCDKGMNIATLYTILNNNPEEIMNFFNKIQKQYNRKISQEYFMNALYKIRRIEYINGIVKNAPTEQYIRNIENKQFSSPNERFLIAVGINKEPNFTKTYRDIKSESIKKDNLRIRLIKDFINILGEEPKSEFIKKM